MVNDLQEPAEVKVSDEEAKAIADFPATFCNKVYISSDGIMFRMTFADTGGDNVGSPRVRAAVALSAFDAQRFYNLLGLKLERVRIEKVEEGPPPQSGDENT